MSDLSTFAARQRVHPIVGFCTPFWVAKSVSTCNCSPAKIEYIPGCALASMRRGEIELLLEHHFFEYLADQKHQTLTVFEQPSGIHFSAWLPDTAFAGAILEAIDKGHIRGCCNVGTIQTVASSEPGLSSVSDYQIAEISILTASAPCFAETWVMREGPEARARIAHADVRHRQYYQDKLTGSRT